MTLYGRSKVVVTLEKSNVNGLPTTSSREGEVVSVFIDVTERLGY